jgi:hypothetical protein
MICVSPRNAPRRQQLGRWQRRLTQLVAGRGCSLHEAERVLAEFHAPGATSAEVRAELAADAEAVARHRERSAAEAVGAVFVFLHRLRCFCVARSCWDQDFACVWRVVGTQIMRGMRPWAVRWHGYKTSMRARHRASIRRRSRFWQWWASISSPNACWAPLAVHPNVPPIAFAPLRHRSTDNRPAQLTIAPQHNHAPRPRSGAGARGGAGRGRLHAGGAAAAARGGDRGGGPAAGGASPALRAPDGRRTHSIDIITRRRRRRRRIRSWRCPASGGPGWEAGRGGGLPGGRGRGAGGVADSVGGRAFPVAWWVAFGAPPPRLDPERPARWLGNRTPHGGGWLTG